MADLEPHDPTELEDEPRPSLIQEFIWFLRENKKWWLVPLILMFLALGALIFLGNSPVMPFIYTLL
ncbi:MAG TPA: DUF5989 family protein [Candidatus Sumerlaeota bacterium]|nr:MAG: hypothetical protein BWZ08_01856 [candidate division BRC1 bacterium ADurb.BinA292]HOE95453.1 DUF5989 family protein [Candidatus Sumerlaeota bacterium]HOR29175.1 DUF5989 family protein [Candidatus Sumerlaeota bacterium]HPK02953.1 DUF5989 family protein [Candidatus Sumerlaeota bacterium]